MVHSAIWREHDHKSQAIDNNLLKSRKLTRQNLKKKREGGGGDKILFQTAKMDNEKQNYKQSR